MIKKESDDILLRAQKLLADYNIVAETKLEIVLSLLRINTANSLELVELIQKKPIKWLGTCTQNPVDWSAKDSIKKFL